MKIHHHTFDDMIRKIHKVVDHMKLQNQTKESNKTLMELYLFLMNINIAILSCKQMEP